MSGKGSGRRPESKPGAYADGHDRIFGRKPIKTQEEFTEWLIASMKEKADDGKPEPSADMR